MSKRFYNSAFERQEYTWKHPAPSSARAALLITTRKETSFPWMFVLFCFFLFCTKILSKKQISFTLEKRCDPKSKSGKMLVQRSHQLFSSGRFHKGPFSHPNTPNLCKKNSQRSWVLKCCHTQSDPVMEQAQTIVGRCKNNSVGHWHPQEDRSPISLHLWPHSLGRNVGGGQQANWLLHSCSLTFSEEEWQGSNWSPREPPHFPCSCVWNFHQHSFLGLFIPLGYWVIAWLCFERTFCVCTMAYCVFWKIMYSKQFLSALVYILCFSISIYFKKKKCQGDMHFCLLWFN